MYQIEDNLRKQTVFCTERVTEVNTKDFYFYVYYAKIASLVKITSHRPFFKLCITVS